jgi:beta-mannosidase
VTDSAIDLAPGDEQVVTCRRLKAGEKMLSWTYLGQHY